MKKRNQKIFDFSRKLLHVFKWFQTGAGFVDETLKIKDIQMPLFSKIK